MKTVDVFALFFNSLSLLLKLHPNIRLLLMQRSSKLF